MFHDDPSCRTQENTRRLRGWGSLRLIGSGEVIISLTGSGTLDVRRLARTAFHFEGTAARRFPSADHLVVTAAHGRMTLRGQDLDLTFRQGYVDVLVRGRFEAVRDGKIARVGGIRDALPGRTHARHDAPAPRHRPLLHDCRR